jgi:hypothetical protein
VRFKFRNTSLAISSTPITLMLQGISP